MKRMFCLILILSLVLGSFSFSFAANNGVTFFYDGYNLNTSVSAFDAIANIVSAIVNLRQDFDTFVSLTGDGNNPTNFGRFQDLYSDIHTIAAEFQYGSGLNPDNNSMVSIIYAMANRLVEGVNLLEYDLDPAVQNINSVLIPNTNSILTFTRTDIKDGLTRRPNYFINGTNGYYYPTPYLDPDEDDWGYNIVYDEYYWGSGSSKLDFIAYMIQRQLRNDVTFNQMTFADVDSTLSTWDSQQDVLTQNTFVPTSLGNGLYKYLAYLQRDVARLTYVMASQEELDMREATLDEQQAVVDGFTGDGAGAISDTNISDMADFSSGAQSNFDTGADPSGIWNVFSAEEGQEWFTQATANELDTSTASTRSLLRSTPDQGYDTPLLDAYYEEIFSFLGVDNAVSD